MIDLKISKTNTNVLLTGAGFTHNFGTPLAENIWYGIFNNTEIQSKKRIRELLLKKLDFEDVYNEVIKGDYTENEKQAIETAVRKEYEDMDAKIRNLTYDSRGPISIDIHKVQLNLINKFSGNDKKGFFFTLNQDLFIERQYYNGTRLYVPGILNNPNWFSTNFLQSIQENELVSLPNDNEVKSDSANFLSYNKFFYIKLHGSYNWLSSDGSRKMVIGLDKRYQINKEPLLAYYKDLFKKILSIGNVKLLIIGYGFGDEHINEIISNSIKNNNLKLYIISPQSIKEFKESISKKKFGKVLLKSLHRYFPYDLLQLFPMNEVTQEANIFNKNYFN